MYHRSYLCVAAHQEDRVDKAYASEADAIMLDLEDGVPDHAKEAARDSAAQIMEKGPSKPTYVRVNDIDSGLCQKDVLAVATPSLKAIRLPKCSRPEDIRSVSGWLDDKGVDGGIQIIVESAAGSRVIDKLASASSRVERVGIGESDMLADLRADFDSETMDYCRAECVVAARAAGLLDPVQSVYPWLRDSTGLRESCVKGKSMGFFGRFSIHPEQLPVINEAFTPGDEEISSAREIVEAARNADGSESSVFLLPNDRLVGPPLLVRAKSILHIAESIDMKNDQ